VPKQTSPWSSINLKIKIFSVILFIVSNSENYLIGIKNFTLSNTGIIEINIEVWNKSSKDLLFSYNPGINFVMTDNTGHVYDLSGPCEISALDNEIVDAQDVEKINFKATASTVIYSDEAIFNSDVTDLYLAMDGFSVFDSVKFLIPIR